MKNNIKIGALVYVEWEDSHHRSGWTTDEPEDDALKCRSVGWVVLKSDYVLVLTANMTCQDGSKQRCGDMTIPCSSIEKIKNLVEP